MSYERRPVRAPEGAARRLPPEVYRRRRLLVLLGVAIVVAVIVLIVVRPPADGTVPAAGTSPAPTAVTGSAATPGQPGVCTSADVTVTAITDADSYPEGVEPQLSWSLANTGSAPCTLNVGTAQQVFTITSGDELIWTSKDCQSDAADYPLTLEPASSGAAPTVSATIAWDRARSDPSSCDSTSATPVTAGGASYHLEVTVGGITSNDSKQFLLQ